MVNTVYHHKVQVAYFLKKKKKEVQRSDGTTLTTEAEVTMVHARSAAGGMNIAAANSGTQNTYMSDGKEADQVWLVSI